MTPGLSRAGAVAVAVGGLGALAPALVLAAPPPGLVAGALAGACWWLAAQAVAGSVQVAWSVAGDRELGVTQRRHLAGIGIGRQCAARAGAALAATGRLAPAAALGAAAAVVGAQWRDGHLHLLGGGTPGPPLLVAALAGPLVGVGLGMLAGLAAPTRRHLSVATLAAAVLTVSVFLLRPSTPAVETWAVAAPLGGAWPVTPGWSLDRYLVLDVSPFRRVASLGGWALLVGLAAARQVRAGAARRTAPPIERP